MEIIGLKLQLYKVGGLHHSPAPMILADALSISINLLLVAHVVISLLLILVVLMQRPKQEGLGAAFGGGVTDQMFGAQTTNVLQKGTVYLGTLFVVLSLVLAILIGNKNHQTAISAPAPPVGEEAPAVPDVVPGGGSIKDELEKDGEEATTPAGGEATTPAGGEATTPADGETTTPADGEATTPADGEATTPVEGEATTPADGEATTPADEESATPATGEASEDKPE